MSLSTVARRAGTSAATVSRYENGWTRFETYTLKKLATVLGCELRIDLRPIRRLMLGQISKSEAVSRLERLFWDSPLKSDSFARYPVWVVERVLEYGNLDDVHILIRVFGRHRFFRYTLESSRLSPRTVSFWDQMLEKEGITCTKRCSRKTALTC